MYNLHLFISRNIAFGPGHFIIPLTAHANACMVIAAYRV